ncbi:MAG: hypothetical protein LAT76_11630 [Schleiferiaceae bacterium]|nr:hypothetical protein [Schleiferiaceae bacterium]
MRANWVFRLFLVFLIGLPAVASETVPHYQLEGAFAVKDFSFSGKLTVSMQAAFSTGDTLWIRHWGNAYQKGSSLYQELIENQNTILHFNKNKGAFHLDSVFVNGNVLFVHNYSIDWSYCLVNEELSDRTFIFTLYFRQLLPDIAINAVGKSLNTTSSFFQVSQLWPELHHNRTKNAARANNNTKLFDNPIKKTWEVALELPQTGQCVCNLKDYSISSKPKRILTGRSHGEMSNSFTVLCGDGYYELTTAFPDGSGQLHLGIKEEFPPTFSASQAVFKVKAFLEQLTGIALPDTVRIAMVTKGSVPPPSPHLITMEYQDHRMDFEIELVKQWTKALLVGHYNIQQLTETWFYTGLPEFIKQQFTQQNYPDKKFLGPYASFWFARFLELDQYNSNYEQQLYFLYMARLSLDQPLSDPFDQHPKGNFLAVLEGKAALNFSYLQSFVSRKTFLRGLRRWFENYENQSSGHVDLMAAIQYFANKDISWWSEDILHTNKRLNYTITAVHKCSYTLGVTVKNKGDLTTPFSITGIRDGKPIITLWYDGFEGEKLVQFHFDDFDALYIDYQNETPEWNNQDNYTRTQGLFPQWQPLKFQFFGGLENPEKTQLFWSPITDYNAYDGILLGFNVFNTSILRKKIEYSVAPVFSTNTGKLTGSAGFTYNITPRSGWFHHIYVGFFGRYYHYADDLSFTRLSPAIGFYFRKPTPRSENIHKIKMRLVAVNREVPNQFDGENQNAFDLNRASYDVFDIRYWWENVSILSPFTLRFDFQQASNFSKVSLDYDKRWMLPNKKWLIWRSFGGLFLKNNANETSFYDFGLSGTRDYLFDYALLGRSDLSGIWSRQFFVTDGGFKSGTEVFSGNWMMTTNVALPIWKFFGVYGDAGFAGNWEDFYWGYGVRISILSDFLEFYLPIQDFNTNYLQTPGYFSNTRFILNISYEQIVQRLRRGYY